MSKQPEDHQLATQAQPIEHVQPSQGYFSPNAAQHRQDEVTYFDYWGVLIRYKRTILITTIFLASLATATAFLMTPKYRADVLMAPVIEDKNSGALSGLMNQFGGLASLAGINVSGGGKVNEAIATLKSRAFTVKFIADNKLLPVLFSDKWNEEKKEWNVKRVEDTPSMWDAYELFNKEIRDVSTDNRSGLMTLSIVWKDREQAVQWANMLVSRVNKTLRDRAIEEAGKSLDFLNKELSKTSIVELQQVIYRLIEVQTNKIMLANVRIEYAFKVIDPAAVPDEDKFVEPKRKLIIFAGLFFGFFMGIVSAFILNFRANRRHEEKSS